MQIFEKLPQMLGLCPPEKKFVPILENRTPQTFGGPAKTVKSSMHYCFEIPRDSIAKNLQTLQPQSPVQIIAYSTQKFTSIVANNF